MPVRKEPNTLFNLSLKTLIWFKNSWKCGKECVPVQLDMLSSSTEVTELSRKVATLKLHIPKLFDDLPVKIFNEIVPKVPAAFFRSCTPKKFCLVCFRKLLTILLTKRLKCWDVIKFVDCDWLEEPLFIAIKSVILLQIPCMKNVVHLCLRWVCDDSFLRCIGENCHLIEYLDIEDSDVTDEGLRYLIPSKKSAGCPKLQELLLVQLKIRISSHTVALLLKSLPDIAYIRYENIRSAIEELLNINELQNSIVLQLKSLKRLDMSFISSDFEEIIRLSKLCPNLEELEIKFCEEKDVLALKHFPCLSQVHIHYHIWNSAVPVAEAKQYFKEYCKQITSLTIRCHVLDTMCISLLSKHCPSLTDLGIKFNDVVENEPFNRDEENNLKILSTFTLEVYDLHDDSRFVIRDLLCSLLKSTDRLTEVTLLLPARCLSHQDLQFLFDVVDMHLLHSLEIITLTFDYSCFNLTMESVHLILEKCPLLKSLGNLKRWNVVDSDVEKLRREMKYSNYDIEIIY